MHIIRLFIDVPLLFATQLVGVACLEGCRLILGVAHIFSGLIHVTLGRLFYFWVVILDILCYE